VVALIQAVEKALRAESEQGKDVSPEEAGDIAEAGAKFIEKVVALVKSA
jgi:hypothetical protein